MEQKTVVFRKGDVIVSGGGNIGIFNGVVDGYMGERFTAYCASSAPAGTDLRYARHATEAEKKIFFNALEKNGYTWNPDTFTIDANEDCVLTENFDYGKVDWKADGMHPFKVVTGEKKKRVRPTWKQVHELEATVNNLEVLCEQKDRLIRELDKGNEELVDKLSDAEVELMRLRNRTFLERVFNK